MELKKKAGRPFGSKKKFDIKSHFSKKELKEFINLAKESARNGNKDMQKFLLEQIYGKPVQSNALTNKQGEDIVIQQVIYSGKGAKLKNRKLNEDSV